MELFSIIYENRENPRMSYVIEVLNAHPYCKDAEVTFSINSDVGKKILYGLKKEGFDTVVPRSAFLFNDTRGAYFMNPYTFNERTVYSVEGSIKDCGVFWAEGQFGFDVFECIFFHLSRYEERDLDFEQYLSKKYEFERQLLLVKSGLEKNPVVDDLIKAFLEVVLEREVKVSRPLSLSHDIDFISKFKSPLSIIRKIAGHIRHRKTLKGFSYLWSSYRAYLFHGQDGFDTFDWMLSKKAIDKTIYFLVGGNHKEDNTYDLKGKTFKKALSLAKERNYHIGIHPSYNSWNDKELILGEKEKLENEVGGEIGRSRQHFLNFDISITPRLLQDIGISEDSSLGYTRHVGYRCGSGFAYKLYDFENEKAFDVVERPLIFMDMAWLHEGIRTGTLDLTSMENYYGCFNFHNSAFDEMGARSIAMKEEYLKIFQ
jgi:hypothetical protein